MFGQTYDAGDLVVIGLLVLLEGVLSIDNALVLGLLAKRLPKHQQKRALTYGLVGAFLFRLVAIATAAYLLKWRIVKLLGGAYLAYVAIKHFFFESKDEHAEGISIGADGHPVLHDETTGQPLSDQEASHELSERSPMPQLKAATAAFWPTVFVIEMTDIAFAVDSILAAIALVGASPNGETTHPKLWVVVIGGFLGVVLMRFAAVLFIKLLDRFPRFVISAYLLVLLIGLKLLADWGFNSPEHPHVVDFHSYRSAAFWVFWILMVGCFAIGFLPQKQAPKQKHAETPVGT